MQKNLEVSDYLIADGLPLDRGRFVWEGSSYKPSRASSVSQRWKHGALNKKHTSQMLTLAQLKSGKLKVIHLCPPLWDPTDCSLPGSSVHGIFQARILQWIAVPYSRGIFLTPGSNPCLLHSRQTLYHLNHQRNSYQLHSQLASSDLLCWALGSMKKLIHIFEAQKEQLARHHRQESKLAV